MDGWMLICMVLGSGRSGFGLGKGKKKGKGREEEDEQFGLKPVRTWKEETCSENHLHQGSPARSLVCE